MLVPAIQTLQISRSTVNRVANLYADTGDVLSHKKSSGRPRIIDGRGVDTISSLINRYPRIDLNGIASVLKAQGFNISKSALRATTARMGYTYKHASIAAAERSTILRSQYINMVAEYDVRQLVWLDETAKDDRTEVKKMGWSYSGTRAQVSSAFSRGDR